MVGKPCLRLFIQQKLFLETAFPFLKIGVLVCIMGGGKVGGLWELLAGNAWGEEGSELQADRIFSVLLHHCSGKIEASKCLFYDLHKKKDIWHFKETLL